MTSDDMRPSRVVALALGVGAFFVTQEVLTDLAAGKRVSVASDVVVVLLFWAVWAFLTPLVLAAVRRWPLDAKPVLRTVLLHGGTATILSVAQSAITSAIRAAVRVVGGGMSAADAVRLSVSPNAFVWALFTGIFFYTVVVTVYTATRFRALYGRERLAAAEFATRTTALEGELTRSKLDTLRSQLRPHFLFNTLNAISVLITEDAEKARKMVLRLSTLLRRSLDEEAHEVSLRHELAFVNDYLDIQRERFGDQLSVEFDVDPAVLDARVPVFLLQPLLENAIEHGRADDNEARMVLRAHRRAEMLHLTVEDRGLGATRQGSAREGIGLRNTRARLHHLYASRATVTFGPANTGADSPGVKVEILIPLGHTTS